MITYTSHLKQYAQRLRREMSPPEQRLWYEYLQHLRPRWTRQKPLGKYIVDFYCHERKLIIEIDSQFHDEIEEQDKARDSYFEKLGLRTLRIYAIDVLSDTGAVCDHLDEVLGIER